MEQNSECGKWSLVVNGEVKPWPVKNYLETTITIDLNWGIDTSIYESTPLTFNASEIINGSSIEGITVDKEHYLIICDIPIRKRTKNFKVIVDWSSLKNSIKNDLQGVVNGKTVKIEDGSINLEGEDITSPINFYYRGEKCDSSEEEGMNIIRVNLPYKNNQSNSCVGWKIPRFKFLFAIIIFLIGLLMGLGYTFIRPKIVVKKEYVEVKTIDTIYVSTSLKDAQLYLQNETIWERDEMERIPELKGLFDDLKEFRFDDIQKRLDCENFKNIKNVQQLLREIESAKHYYDIDKKELKYYIKRQSILWDEKISYKRYITVLHDIIRESKKERKRDSKIGELKCLD